MEGLRGRKGLGLSHHKRRLINQGFRFGAEVIMEKKNPTEIQLENIQNAATFIFHSPHSMRETE